MAPPLVVAILGPTASGKRALALAAAEAYGGEIINCDSTAVYRGFDIGTDKIGLSDRRGIPHHLIDIVDATENILPRNSREMPRRPSATCRRADMCRSWLEGPASTIAR